MLWIMIWIRGSDAPCQRLITRHVQSWDREGKQHDIWRVLPHTYVLNSSHRLLSTPRVRYIIICMFIIPPIVQIEFLPACESRTYRLLISCRLEEHRACYRKTMSIAE